jgi:type IV pilus assembly protein PilV
MTTAHHAAVPAAGLSCRGFTMIEVMVSLIILTIGLLGLAALQGTGYRFNATAYQRTQATIAAYDIIDRMRANDTAVKGGKYDVTTETLAKTVKTTTLPSCTSAPCDSNTLATYDLVQWYGILQALLPQDDDHLSTLVRDPATGRVTITIRWVERGGTCAAEPDVKNLRCQQWVVGI